MSEKAITLNYGGKTLTLRQSEKFIGVRGNRGARNEAHQAVTRTLGNSAWSAAGRLGGFDIVSVDRPAIDTDAALDTIRRSNDVSVGTHVFHSGDDPALYVPTGDVYIRFKSGVTPADKQKLIQQHGLVIKEARGDDAFITAVTEASENPVKVAAALQGEASVATAEPDLATKAALKSLLMDGADGLLSEQWHLRNNGFHRGSATGFVKGADARVIDAWSAGNTNGRAAVIIGMIDDGFDLDHPDFRPSGKYVHPWDFTRNSADPRPDDGDWHGTACAGVATASAGGGMVVGAAPGCTLMPVRWKPEVSDTQIERWFEYVTSNGAWIVSCSWGVDASNFVLSERMQAAIAKCAREGRGGLGCVVVFAAGNENSDVSDFPRTSNGFATHPDVIAVAASTSMDERAHYSNFGDAISVCAPSSGKGGWGILTCDATDSASRVRGYVAGDYDYEFGGTSSACPLVAGVAALILSVAPNLRAAEVKRILEQSARKIGGAGAYDAAGHSRNFGYGCIDAAAAVKRALSTRA